MNYSEYGRFFPLEKLKKKDEHRMNEEEKRIIESMEALRLCICAIAIERVCDCMRTHLINTNS